MTEKWCVDCVFSHFHREGDKSLLECRRHAPVADVQRGGAVWPEVDPDDGCGEFDDGGKQ